MTRASKEICPGPPSSSVHATATYAPAVSCNTSTEATAATLNITTNNTKAATRVNNPNTKAATTPLKAKINTVANASPMGSPAAVIASLSGQGALGPKKWLNPARASSHTWKTNNNQATSTRANKAPTSRKSVEATSVNGNGAGMQK